MRPWPHTGSMARRAEVPAEELTRRYQSGAPLQELADRYGVSTATIRSRLTAAGVELRGRGAPRREVDLSELVYETHLAGSVRAAARRLGVDRGTARRRLDELHRSAPGVGTLSC